MSDEEKRKIYDKSGEEGVSKMGNGQGHDPFSSFFGDFGFSFFGDRHSHDDETPRGADVTIDVYASLEEVRFLN